ncbi:MAG TPA: hypothetical protein VFF29_05295 [Bacteroidota bacterium]|nr:hypothetical protein [Bacteroidota bacterium]
MIVNLRNTFFVFSIALVLLLVGVHCKSADERKKERATRDSIYQTQSPSRTAGGTYERQRDAVGNIDSLVTPPQPVRPR